MTEADAVEILDNLTAAGNVPQVDNPELQTKINAALADINDEPGDSKKDKLAEFLKKNQGQKSAAGLSP